MLTQENFNEQHYERNIALLHEIDPCNALRLELMPIKDTMKVCKTEKGELNLSLNKYGMTSYFHAPAGPLEECQAMMTEEIKTHGESLFVYGIGLGYAYEAFLPWLRENPTRYLILLEDDLEVIFYFLHTEKATKILEDKQVTFFAFQDYYHEYVRILSLLASYINTKIDFITTPYYLIKKPDTSFSLNYNFLFEGKMMTMIINEFLSGQAGYLKNFYRNIFHLPKSYLVRGMLQQFRGIPAIICGAGPSIHKNIDLLKTLGDKAVIFAGGSSLNVLNSAGIQPHFGLGIDPNKEQKHRLLTNDSFHLPYLFRPRVSHDAFMLMQGPKIYVPGSATLLAQWFEKELDISMPVLDEGHNVINFCTEVASRMGFNPIIYVGMDLAFTEIQTYATGISTHPLWIEKSNPYGAHKLEAVIRSDIYGNTTKTKWDWVGEANWLSHFSESHRDIQMINATEGGIGFSPVPNKTLQETADQYLDKTYDLTGMVHAMIQNSPIGIKQADVTGRYVDLKRSLDRCLVDHQKIIVEKAHQLKESAHPEYDTVSTIIVEDEIQHEVAYTCYLKSIEDVYTYMQTTDRLYKHNSPSSFRMRLSTQGFLESAARQNIQLMTDAFQYYIQSHQSPLAEKKPQRKDVPKTKQEIYRFENGFLELVDSVIDLHIENTLEEMEDLITDQTKYPDGKIKQVSYTYRKQLHGPSRYFSPTGQLLAESWFFKNQKEGKTLHNYLSGAPYCLLYYKNNQLHGPQSYYFENGRLSVSMQYQEGFLHGEVRTYNEEGQCLRELHYTKGKRNGAERMWHSNGQLLIECHYENGLPKGRAQEWTPTGWLFKEINIHQFPDDFNLSMYDKEGQKIRAFDRGIEDYTPMYEIAQKKIHTLEDNIDNIMKAVDPYLKDIDNLAEDHPALYAQYMKIHQGREEMEKLKHSLDENQIHNLAKVEEWKKTNKG